MCGMLYVCKVCVVMRGLSHFVLELGLKKNLDA
jgi:hypothetical protein